MGARSFQIAPLTDEHLGGTAEVVAREQDVANRHQPGLAQRYLDPELCRTRLVLLSDDFIGRVALEGDRPIAVMHAGIEESEAQIPASGTTVDPDVGDVTAVLGAPYAACATEALAAPVLAVGDGRARVLDGAARGVPPDHGAALLVLHATVSQ